MATSFLEGTPRTEVVTPPDILLKADTTVLADAFSSTSTYIVGELVSYNGKCYECNVAVTEAGEWTGSKNWVEIRPLAQEIWNIGVGVHHANHVAQDALDHSLQAIDEAGRAAAVAAQADNNAQSASSAAQKARDMAEDAVSTAKRADDKGNLAIEESHVANATANAAHADAASALTLATRLSEKEQYAEWYPDGTVTSSADFTSGIKFDEANKDSIHYTIEVLPFSKVDDTGTKDNSGLGGRVVIPPYTDIQGGRYTVVGIAGATSTYGNNSYLASVIAPTTVKNIGSLAFDACESLTTASFPAVTTIDTMAFRECSSLVSVSLPMVTTIGMAAFVNCSSMVSISLPKATTIGSIVFYGCRSLVSVSLPMATTIGDLTFGACQSLATIDFGEGARETVPILRAVDAFAGVPLTCIIIVPDAQYDAWVTATNWADLVTQGYRFLRHSEWEYARKYELPNDYAVSVDNVTPTANKNIDLTAVRYGVAQSLTGKQHTQVCSNIGAQLELDIDATNGDIFYVKDDGKPDPHVTSASWIGSPQTNYIKVGQPFAAYGENLVFKPALGDIATLSYYNREEQKTQTANLTVTVSDFDHIAYAWPEEFADIDEYAYEGMEFTLTSTSCGGNPNAQKVTNIAHPKWTLGGQTAEAGHTPLVRTISWIGADETNTIKVGQPFAAYGEALNFNPSLGDTATLSAEVEGQIVSANLIVTVSDYDHISFAYPGDVEFVDIEDGVEATLTIVSRNGIDGATPTTNTKVIVVGI